jgi:hypothetical protein
MTVSEKLNKLLDLVVANIGRGEVAKYPDMRSLEEGVILHKIKCGKKIKYSCYACKIKSRNKCWRRVQACEKKKEMKKLVNNGIDREMLQKMKMSELYMLASIVGVQFKFGSKASKGTIINCILKRIENKKKGGE